MVCVKYRVVKGCVLKGKVTVQPMWGWYSFVVKQERRVKSEGKEQYNPVERKGRNGRSYTMDGYVWIRIREWDEKKNPRQQLYGVGNGLEHTQYTVLVSSSVECGVRETWRPYFCSLQYVLNYTQWAGWVCAYNSHGWYMAVNRWHATAMLLFCVGDAL